VEGGASAAPEENNSGRQPVAQSSLPGEGVKEQDRVDGGGNEVGGGDDDHYASEDPDDMVAMMAAEGEEGEEQQAMDQD
jgi:hypothetical protein